MFPNGNVGLENSKFYEDVPARGHLIGRAATGSCRKGHQLEQNHHDVFALPPFDVTDDVSKTGWPALLSALGQKRTLFAAPVSA